MHKAKLHKGMPYKLSACCTREKEGHSVQQLCQQSESILVCNVISTQMNAHNMLQLIFSTRPLRRTICEHYSCPSHSEERIGD